MVENKIYIERRRKKETIAITYSRCSTKKQDLESQNQRLFTWAKEYNKHIHFEDLAISGRKSDREGINDLLQYVRDNKELNLLVGVIELSRIGRSIGFICNTIKELSDLGVCIVLVNSNMKLDYNSVEGSATINALAMASDIEWRLISERNKRGREKIQRDNIKVGRKHQEISLTAIQSLKEKGLSYRQIAQELNTSPQTIMRRLK